MGICEEERERKPYINNNYGFNFDRCIIKELNIAQNIGSNFVYNNRKELSVCSCLSCGEPIGKNFTLKEMF